MVIGIEPVLVAVGPLAVRWSGLLALAGLGLGIWLTLRNARRQGLRAAPVLDALAWAIPTGVLAAWVVHLLSWWDYYLTRSSEIWQLGLDSLSLWGALVGGGLVAAARLRHEPHRRRRIFEAAAPAVAFGIAVGRFGAFLDGHGQGLPSDLPWATRYASPLAASPDFGVPRHPAQLYDGLVALALALFLPRVAFGWRLPTFMASYSLARIALGMVRLDPPFLLGLQIEQILAAGVVAFVAVQVVRRVARRRHPQAADQAPQQRDSLAA